MLEIDGDIWTVKEEEILGLCEHATHTISLRTSLKPKMRLLVLVHELLHAARPDFTETDVGYLDQILQEGLWADGWRRKPRKPRQK